MTILDKPLSVLYHEGNAFLMDNIAAVVVLALLLLIFLNVRAGNLRWPWERAPMATIDEEVREKAIIADCLTDALEDAVHQERLTREAAQKWYTRFGNLFTLPDVLPSGEKPLAARLKDKRLFKAEDPPFTPDPPKKAKLKLKTV